jgi:hypothetical protein
MFLADSASMARTVRALGPLGRNTDLIAEHRPHIFTQTPVARTQRVPPNIALGRRVSVAGCLSAIRPPNSSVYNIADTVRRQRYAAVFVNEPVGPEKRSEAESFQRAYLRFAAMLL